MFLEDMEIWYLDVLSGSDVTKYDAVRQCKLRDAFLAMEYIFKR